MACGKTLSFGPSWEMHSAFFHIFFASVDFSVYLFFLKMYFCTFLGFLLQIFNFFFQLFLSQNPAKTVKACILARQDGGMAVGQGPNNSGGGSNTPAK